MKNRKDEWLHVLLVLGIAVVGGVIGFSIKLWACHQMHPGAPWWLCFLD